MIVQQIAEVVMMWRNHNTQMTFSRTFDTRDTMTVEIETETMIGEYMTAGDKQRQQCTGYNNIEQV